MGSKPKAPVIAVPDMSVALPPPAMQTNMNAGTAAAAKGSAAMAAGLGMNDTVLTSPMGTTAPSTTRKSLLGA